MVRRTKFLLLGWIVTSTFAAVVLAVACTPQPDVDMSAWVETLRINQELELGLLPNGPQSAQLNVPLQLVIENQSGAAITFSADFGLRLLAKSKATQEWQEIENLVEYLPADHDVVLGPSDDPLTNFTTFSALPKIEQRGEFSQLRLIIVGRDDAGGLVAAYVDVPIEE